MSRPLAVMKPDYANALIPLVAKYLFYGLILGVIIYFIGTFTTIKENLGSTQFILYIIFLVILIAAIPTLFLTVILYNTTYYFFRNYLIHEYKFIKIKKDSVLYNKIVNISVRISLWDRLCNAGDIILQTAQDDEPDVVLRYIKDPEFIEKRIYKLIGLHG